MSVSFAPTAAVEYIQKENSGNRKFPSKNVAGHTKLNEGCNPNSAIVTLRLSLSVLIEDYIMDAAKMHDVKLQAFDEFKYCIDKLSTVYHHAAAHKLYDGFMATLASPSELSKETEKHRFLLREQIQTRYLEMQSEARYEKELKEDAEEQIRIAQSHVMQKFDLRKYLANLHMEIKKKELRKELVKLQTEVKEKELRQKLAEVQEELRKKEVRRQIISAQQELSDLQEEVKMKEFKKQFLVSHGSKC